MPQRRSVQLLPARSPTRHCFIHEGAETVVVTSFAKVDKLVYQEVLQAANKLLGQLEG